MRSENDEPARGEGQAQMVAFRGVRLWSLTPQTQRNINDTNELSVDTFAQQQQMLTDWETQRAKRDKPRWKFW